MIIVVAADGSGDVTSIQEAVDRLPEHAEEQRVIRIQPGVYKEKLHIHKPRITFVGEQAESTILTFDDYARKLYPNGEAYNTFNSYSLFVGADDIIFESLTLENAAGRGDDVGQAVAAYVDGDRIQFRSCRLLGHQDTLFTGPLPDAPIERTTFGGPREGAPRHHGRQLYSQCYIEGDVDFIFGSAVAVFEQCEIFSKKRPTEVEIHGYITAASTPEQLAYGYVFIDCKLTGDAPPQSVYLGRPWRIHAKTAFINCWMGEHIRAEGWHNWNKPESEQTTRYCEYNSTGPGAAADRRVTWSRQLSAEEAEGYSITRVFDRGDGWQWDQEA
jgi:pectinesterase